MEEKISSRMEVYWQGKPTFASFLGYYLAYSLPIISILIVQFMATIADRKMIDAFVTILGVFSWVFPGMNGLETMYYAAGVLLTILIGVIIWLTKVKLKPLLYYLAAFIGIEALRIYTRMNWGFSERFFLLTVVSLAGIAVVDLYRRSFTYTITRNVITVEGGLISSVERSVMISKINDVIVVKPLLGKILGFGHVIPVTPSQIGLGETFSVGGVGGNVPKTPINVGVGGGRTIVDFRPRPENSLYGVSEPGVVKELIIRLSSMGDEYLRESTERLKNIEKILREK
ncbi:MAG: hypothetical protein DRJ35_03625 [Thermoprotei archaeon]|nr:MAG: hypothetical protein DRJ35_03625 [Thermoprotei archaeon]